MGTRKKPEPAAAKPGLAEQFRAAFTLPEAVRSVLRHRTLLVWLAPVLVLAALWATDPDGGATTKQWIVRVLVGVFLIALSHWVRRAYFDYPEADVRTLFRRAGSTSTGSGLALIAVAIFLFAVLMLFAGRAGAQDVRTFIPPQAHQHLPTLAAERARFWSDHSQPELLPALIEHESCLRLTHSRCWNPASRLKSAREEGAGLGQITRAFRPDGSTRFDALAEMRDRHPSLREWSWSTVYQRPDLQLRAVVLKMRDNHRFFTGLGVSPAEALQFADAGYNGGNGGVQADRRACRAKPGCDPGRWFGHVERTCTKSHAALYGNRSACDINRHHVHDVTQVRAAKYRGLV